MALFTGRTSKRRSSASLPSGHQQQLIKEEMINEIQELKLSGYSFGEMVEELRRRDSRKFASAATDIGR
jgi:HAMP domain-containing protein